MESFALGSLEGAPLTTEVHVYAAYDILCKEAQNTLELWAWCPGDISMKRYPDVNASL